eukprot:COSAG06_NODE_3488_length_5272_cov_8.685720_2_plen_30_part_00
MQSVEKRWRFFLVGTLCMAADILKEAGAS